MPNNAKALSLKVQATGTLVAARTGTVEMVTDQATKKMGSIDDQGVFTPYGTGSINEFQIIYFGKHGDNSSNGFSLSQAKLTITAAIAAAVALSPTSSNRFVIRGEDGGIYTEGFTIPSWIGVEAPAALVVGNIIMKGNSGLSLQRLNVSSGTGIIKNGDSMHCQIVIQRIEATSAAKCIDVDDGTMMINAQMITNVTGDAVNITSGTGAEIRGFINHISGSGAGDAIAISGHASNKISLSMVDLRDNGSGTGIDLDTGELNLTISHFNPTTGGDLAAATELNMMVGELNSKTFSGSGTQNITKAGDGGIIDVEADPNPKLGNNLNMNEFALIGNAAGKFLDFIDDTTPVAYIEVFNADNGVSPKMGVAGPATNIGFDLDAKGEFGLVRSLTTFIVVGGVQATSTNTASFFNPMTEAQMNALGTPPNGYLCYNTTRLQYCQYNGDSWGPFTTGGLVKAEVGTTYTFVNADNGVFITFDNSSPITASLNTGLTDKFHCQIFNKGAGQVTVDGTATLKNFDTHTKLAGQNAAAAIQNYGVTDVYSFQGQTA